MFFLPIRSMALIVAGTVPLVLFGATSQSRAADASAWDGDSRAAARLIAGHAQGEGPHRVLRGGIDIKLAPGWKTYWRYPGDSGVPPHFDFANSENVKSVAVAWPAPRRFSDAEGNTIGYKDRLLLPLRIEAQQPDRPTVLRLKLDYAICEKLCVPAQAQAELTLGPGSADTDAAISDMENRVPKHIAFGTTAPLSIKRVAREGGTPGKVIVDVAAPAGAKIELFAEGPTADWALPLPEPVDGAPAGQQRFAFVLDGLPSGAKPDGAKITLTAVSGNDAIETTVPLD